MANQYDHGSMVAAYGAPPPPKDSLDGLTVPLDGWVVPAAPCPACGKLGLHLCAEWYPKLEERERQRKHEATHGWRNPPSIYEEDQ